MVQKITGSNPSICTFKPIVSVVTSMMFLFLKSSFWRNIASSLWDQTDAAPHSAVIIWEGVFPLIDNCDYISRRLNHVLAAKSFLGVVISLLLSRKSC